MAKTLYAWTPILYGTEVDPKTGVRNPRGDRIVQPGEVVTAEKLGVEDDDFQAMVDAGSIRTMKYPDDIPKGYEGSVIDWLRRKAAEAANEVENGISALNTNINEPTVTAKQEEVAVAEDTGTKDPAGNTNTGSDTPPKA